MEPIQIYFPDKSVHLPPFPKCTLSFQKTVEFCASLPWLSKEAEYDITKVHTSLLMVRSLSKIASYAAYPGILLPIQSLSLLAHAINPLYSSAFAIVKIAFSLLALGLTTKWTLEGSLGQLSRDLYDFSVSADNYIEKIDSNLKDYNTEIYEKAIFSSPPQLPDSSISRPINSFIQYVYSQKVKISQYFGL